MTPRGPFGEKNYNLDNNFAMIWELIVVTTLLTTVFIYDTSSHSDLLFDLIFLISLLRFKLLNAVLKNQIPAL